MKKKGLIISTVVMAVVLIAALTTSTYAWFSTSSAASVDNITVTVGNAQDILVGVRTLGDNDTPTSLNDFAGGTVYFDQTNTKKWKGTGTLGESVSFVLDNTSNGTANSRSLSKAVSYSSSAINGVTGWYTGNATLGSSLATSTVTQAINGNDYLDITFIVIPGKVDAVNQTYLALSVTPTNTSKIGMAAALHLYIAEGTSSQALSSFTSQTVTASSKTYGSDFSTISNNIEAYPGLLYSNSWSGTPIYGNYNSTTKEWILNVPIHEYKSTPYTTEFGTGKQIRIIAWFEGSDDSCVTGTAGTGAVIKFDFKSTNTEKTISADGKIS